MSFEFVKKLPTPSEIREQLPLPAGLTEIKKARDAEIRAVLTGQDNRFLVIIGPCSADNADSVCDYVSRLARVSRQVKDKLILIPRIYTNKPRTTGEGYKGIVHQPDPEKKPDFLAGLIAMRNPGSPPRTKCSTRKTGGMSPIFSPMWPSAPVPWRISSTV